MEEDPQKTGKSPTGLKNNSQGMRPHPVTSRGILANVSGFFNGIDHPSRRFSGPAQSVYWSLHTIDLKAMFSDPFFTKSCPAGFTGQDRVVAAETASLLAMGWTFTAEPTADSRWRVSGAKGEIRISSRAARLGDAFLEVEHEARLREQMACIPSEGVESHRNDRRSA